MTDAYDEAKDCGDDEEARLIEQDIRETERELRDHERWEEEGQERGWA